MSTNDTNSPDRTRVGQYEHRLLIDEYLTDDDEEVFRATERGNRDELYGEGPTVLQAVEAYAEACREEARR